MKFGIDTARTRVFSVPRVAIAAFLALASTARADAQAVSGEVKVADGSTPPPQTKATVYCHQPPPYPLGELCWSATIPSNLTGEFPGALSGNIIGVIADEGESVPVEFRASAVTVLSAPAGGALPAAFYFVTGTPQVLSCNNESGCSGNFDLGLYSRYGNVSGQVVYKDGTPAGDITVVAADPSGMFSGRSVVTDFAGYFDFKAATTQPLVPQAVPVALDPANNWGLPVTRPDGSDGPGSKLWRISVARSSNKPAGESVLVTSNEQASAGVFIILMPGEEECSRPRLTSVASRFCPPPTSA